MSKKKGLGNPLLLASAAGSLDPTTKKVLLFGGVAVVGFLGYKIYKKIFVPKVDEQVSEMNNRIAKIAKTIDRKNRSITDEQAYQIAVALFEAMNGNGTNEKLVYNQLNKLKTRDDYLTVYVTFGAKPYGWSGETTNLWAKHAWADGKDLHGWFLAEFSRNEIDEKLNPILKLFGEQL